MRITTDHAQTLSAEQTQRLSNFCAHASRNFMPIAQCFVQRFSGTFPPIARLMPTESATQRHALATFVSEMVKHISTPEACGEGLQRVASRCTRAGLNPSHFSALRSALLFALSTKGGVEWTAQIERDWTEAIDLWFNFTFAGVMQTQHAASQPARRRAA
jgi:hemoglobin-like flavoprotein